VGFLISGRGSWSVGFLVSGRVGLESSTRILRGSTICVGRPSLFGKVLFEKRLGWKMSDSSRDASSLSHLLDRNKSWAQAMVNANPSYFSEHLSSQNPDLLWIGCADSRVPANQVVDLPPGKVFVHRNVANVVSHSDFNCLSVLEFAVAVLKVQHVVVCGHYGCGGVNAALQDNRFGLIDNWLRHIRDVRQKHYDALYSPGVSESERLDLLCEYNVMEQVQNVASTTIVQSAWEQGRPLTIHGWIYRLQDGIIRDLDVRISKLEDIPRVYHTVKHDHRSPSLRPSNLPKMPPKVQKEI